MRDITLKQLRYLSQTVRSGSLAGAATTLHVTGPAIAQQLRLLERSLGMALIERGPGGQHATEAGRVLVDTCARLEAELLACEHVLGGLRSARTGRVKLGAVSSAKYFVPQVLGAFRRLHPDVSLTLAVGNRDEVLAQLENYEIDLALMGRPPVRLEVEQQEVGLHPYVIIAAPDHALAGRPAIAMERMATESFLHREAGSGTRLHLESLFAAAELQPRLGMEMASNETIKQAVMAGLGVALISAHTIEAEVRDARLVVLDVQGLPIRRHWLVVRMARRGVTPARGALWDFFIDEVGGLLPVVPGAGD